MGFHLGLWLDWFNFLKKIEVVVWPPSSSSYSRATERPTAESCRRYSGEVFTRRHRAMGIRDRPIAPRSPWQNGYCERLIGSIRRECLDHVLVFLASGIFALLCAHADYYKRTPTHLALDKDSPALRAIEPFGRIVVVPILGGLHHQYVRI
jgi:transposase InsO family protein